MCRFCVLVCRSHAAGFDVFLLNHVTVCVGGWVDWLS